MARLERFDQCREIVERAAQAKAADRPFRCWKIFWNIRSTLSMVSCADPPLLQRSFAMEAVFTVSRAQPRDY